MRQDLSQAGGHRVLREGIYVADEQIKKTEAKRLEIAAPFKDDVLRLQSVPGVGPIVALTTIAALSDVEIFPSPKHVASYAGLVPRMAQSGDMNRHGHSTKTGNPELRSMLCEAAHHASKKNNPFNPLFARVCARKGYRVVVIAVAHKILRILWFMLKHKTSFSLEPLGLEEGHFVTKSVKTYRLRKAKVSA